MPARHSHEASTDYSTQHYFTAELFAKNASEMERAAEGSSVPVDTYYRHQAYVSGAVFASVAFLEAYINELFHHCDESPATVASLGLNAHRIELLARLWRRGVPRTARYGVAEKYEIALDLLSAKQFDRGRSPYQDVRQLVSIRNKLVHYEPDAYPIPGPYLSEVPHEAVPKFERSLHNKFPLNPLAREDFGFFPDKCLSAGCAAWALRTSQEFALEFCVNAGIEERFKDPLATLRARRSQIVTGRRRKSSSFWVP